MASIPDKSIERIIAEALKDKTATVYRPSVWNVTEDDGNGNIYTSTNTGTQTYQRMSGWKSNAVRGTDSTDYIYSGSGNDVVWGNGGNDVLNGESGNDVVIGGSGNNVLYGEDGDDLLIGGINLYTPSNTDFLKAWRDEFAQVDRMSDEQLKAYFSRNSGSNEFFGGSGNDTIIGGHGSNKAYGGEGNDLIILGNGANSIEGGAGNDTIIAGSGANTIKAGDGDDLIMMGHGVNSIDGGEGIDIVGFSEVGSGVYADLMYGTLGNSKLENIEGFHGSRFNDTLLGDDNANLFDGGGGQDVIDGRGGDDTLSFRSSGQGVVVNMNTKTAHLNDDEQTSLGSFNNIENIIGSEYSDDITGDDGNNRIDVHGGSGNTVNAGAGNDTIIGVAGTYIADKLVLNNIYNGGDGFDLVDYSTMLRNSTIDLASGKASFWDGSGMNAHDTLTSIEGIIGGRSNDTITAGNSGSYIDGNSGNDLIISGAGADTLLGGLGNDTLSYKNSSAGVRVDLQNNTASGGHAQGDVISGFEGLIGSAHDDYLVGADSGSQLFGGAGNDTLIGGSGNDLLDGGSGTNHLVGGDGNDTFIGGSGGNNLMDGGSGHDAVSYAKAESGVLINMGTGAAGNGDRLISIEEVIGSAHADTIYGSDQSETIMGGGGADYIYASGGGDRIHGDAQSTVDYSLSHEGVSIRLQSGLGSGGIAEGDTLSGVTNIVGSGHNDTIMGHSSIANKLEGGDGDDLLIANESRDLYNTRDTLLGGAGNDTLIGGTGGDLLDGGDGMDIVDYADSNAGVLINLMTGAASGGHAGGDTLISIEGVVGSKYNDTVTAGDSDGYFDLGDGNDSMNAGAGAHTMLGGNGTDILSYAASTAGVTLDFTTGRGSGGFAEGDVFSGFDSIAGSNHDDSFIGSATGPATINGGAGNDYYTAGAGAIFFSGGTGTDTADYSRSDAGVFISSSNLGTGGYAQGDKLSSVEVIIGSRFDDSIMANQANSTLMGGDGNDTLAGLGGVNYFDGGDGLDVVSYARSGGGGALYADFRTNELRGGSLSADTLISIEGLIGGNYSDTFHGGYAPTYLDGGAGNDLLYAHAAGATLLGGAGNDTLYADASGTYMDGGLGNDVIYGAAGNDTILGGAGNDLIEASAGSDYIDGGDGVDSVSYAQSKAGVYINLSTGEARGGLAAGDTIVNVEGIVGSRYNDTLVGSQAAADTMNGGDGNDYFYASSARNSINGGAGVDTVDYSLSDSAVSATLGGQGAGGAAGDVIKEVEVLIGSNFNDSLTGSAAADTLIGGLGDDTLNGGNGADYLDGGEGNDWVSYLQSGSVNVNLQTGRGSLGQAAGDTLVSIENVIGSNYNDTIIGNAADNYLMGNNGNDSLVGGAGNDTLSGGAGADTLDGGDGLDVAEYSASNAAVNINLATGVVSGGHATGDKLISIEGVIGSNYNDTITGSSAANYIATGAGNDMIYSGGGADTIDGGLGTDTLSFANSTAGVYVNLETGEGRGGFAEGNVISNIEVVWGSAYNDTIIGTAGQDSFYGSGGSDHFDGGAGIDRLYYTNSTSGVHIDVLAGVGLAGQAAGDSFTNIEWFEGSSYNDTIVAGDNGGTYNGGKGDDYIYAGAGADSLNASVGVDTLDYSRSDAGVNVNLGTNAVSGGYAQGDTISGFEAVVGSQFNDVLIGRANQKNTLIGGAGDDRLEANDNGYGSLLDGGDGNDILVAHNGADTIIGGDGFDFVSYFGSQMQAVTVNLTTGVHTGGYAAGDQISGVEGVIGTRHNDVITGDANDNILYGAYGSDTLTGCAGADTFAFNFNNKNGKQRGRDVITDFSASDGDTILLYSDSGTGTMGFKKGGPIVSRESINGFFEGHNTVLVTGDSGTFLMVDLNGNGNLDETDHQIQLIGVDNFSASSITWTDQLFKG